METILSVNEVEPLAASVFPNPAQDVLNIRIGEALAPDALIEIYGVSGIKYLSVITKTSETARINVADLPAGMYVVAITSGGSHFHGKFVKAD